MENPLSLLRFTNRPSLPMLLQSEVAECGLACMAMVASYHGHQLDLNSVRRYYPISLRGTNLQHLSELADRLGFSCRALRLELGEMGQLQLPAILHWDLNHFVVLKKVTDTGVIVHDPAHGVRTYTFAEASKHFSGVALELQPSTKFEKKDEREKLPLGPIIKKMVGLKGSLLRLFALSMVLQLFAIISPFYMQLVVDEGIVSHDQHLLTVLSLGFFLVAVIQIGVSFLRGYFMLYVGNLMSIQLAANLFRHLIRLPMSFFEKRHIGDIVSRFGSLGRIKQLLTTDIIEAIVDGMMAITTLVMMMMYASTLGYIVLASVTIYGVIRFALYRPLKTLTEESIVCSAKEHSTFMETVRAIQSIKVFGKEVQRQSVWQNRYADALNADIKVSKLSLYYSALNGLLFGMENILVIYTGANMVLANAMSVGMLFAFISYKTQFEGKATNLINKVIELRMLGLHLERLADIALTPPELVDQNLIVAEKEVKIEGRLDIEGLSYTYPGGDKPVFKGLNATILPGESVAIVGPSGCGKTTLVKVMMGLLEPTDGIVRIDGEDIRILGIAQYRKVVASVMQNDQLLSGSISDNICFFEPNLDTERMIKAAKMAAIHTDIQQMAMGYSTLIGDMGAALSGGQKQRLLLARALYAQPAILFLDEATSHLDVHLEQVVNTAIKTLNMTRIIVAHRPETIRSADRVLVLTPQGLIEQPKGMA